MTEPDDDPNAMATLRAMFKAKGHDNSAKPRRQREKKIKATVSRQSLRATGRTEVFSFRCREDLLEEVKRVSREQQIPIAQWMEQIIDAALAMDQANA